MRGERKRKRKRKRRGKGRVREDVNFFPAIRQYMLAC
jgi:hypothetical protein